MSLFNDPTQVLLPTIKITGFKDKEQKSEIGSISVPYDPETLDVQIEYCVVNDNAYQDSGTDSHFNRAKPGELNVTLLLDDITYSNPVAYAMPSMSPKGSVDAKLKRLQTICGLTGDEQYPLPHVAIKCKNMPLLNNASGTFHGVLTKLKVKNEIVDKQGNRIKAKVECSFKHVDIKPPEKQGNSSMTKVEMETADAALAAMAINNYGTVAAVAVLAAKNGLNTVRKTIPGKVIESPAKKVVDKVIDTAIDTAKDSVS